MYTNNLSGQTANSFDEWRNSMTEFAEVPATLEGVYAEGEFLSLFVYCDGFGIAMLDTDENDAFHAIVGREEILTDTLSKAEEWLWDQLYID